MLGQDQVRARALAILASTAPIEVADFPDQAASLKFACGRLELIETVLAWTHVIVGLIEDAAQLAHVRVLKTDAQGALVDIADGMLAIASYQSFVVGPAGLQLSAECVTKRVEWSGSVRSTT